MTTIEGWKSQCEDDDDGDEHIGDDGDDDGGDDGSVCDPGGKIIVSLNFLFFFGFSDLVLWTFRSFFFRFSTCSSLDFLFFEEVITYQVISLGHTV